MSPQKAVQNLLVVNAYRCFVESDEHNEGHKITKGEIFLEPDSTVKCFDSSIYYFVFILRSLHTCSRKNKREVVFVKRRISTAYSLVAVIAALQFLYGLAKNFGALGFTG